MAMKKSKVAAAAGVLPAETPSPWLGHASVATAVGIAALYIATAHRSVPGGDSGELISTSWELGVAHPPGYPLWTMLVHVWMRYVFVVGAPAFRANVFSALCGGGAAGLVAHTAGTLAGGSWPAGLVAAALFALPRLTWMYSIQGEVFALNNLLVALLLALLVRFERVRTVGAAAWGSFVCGLALANQLTAVLFIVLIAPWVVWRLHTSRLLSPRACVWLALAFLAGFSPYLYLPWSAWRNTARLTWGDQRSLRGLVAHMLREEYGTFALAKGDRSTSDFWRGVATHAAAFARETLGAGPLLLVPAALYLFRGSDDAAPAARVLLACVLFYQGFFNWRANLDLGNRLLAGVQERFWMQANLVAAVFAGAGFALAGRRLRVPPVWRGAAAIALVVLLARANVQDESRNTAVGDFGRTLLQGLPPNAILLLLGDLPGNAARYMQACENVRPDVRLIDLEMMTFDWYLPMLEHTFPNVTFPAKIKTYRLGADYFDMKKFFDANIDKFDIFVFEKLNEQDSSWQRHYELWNAGLAKAVKRKRAALDVDAWYQQGMRVIGKYPLPDPVVYDDRTWEHVVYEGQLISAVNFALFFEEKAKTARDNQQQIERRQAALDVYGNIMNMTVFDGHRPDFWYKNYGLTAYEQFQRTEDKALLPIVFEHWNHYIASAAVDEQKVIMQNVLDQLPKA